MLKYNHLGIPTKIKKANERYLPQFKMYVSGHEDSIFKIEWMRFELDCPIPEIVKNIPHVAFEVDDLAEATKDKTILIEPNSPSDGVQVAFIEENGASFELMQISSIEQK